ncbi:ATP synthase F1 subunit delta [candidate division GN15 bacterium]|nr:ATP synthase F1 subunit delta [candidate division GN15 bacterium]
MIVQEVAKKYANALFLSVRDRGLIDQAYEQLESVHDLIVRDRTLLNFLSSPKISEEQKVELIRKVFGDRIETLFVEFLLVLVRKRRAAFLPEVLDEFIRLVQHHKGINRVTVITAIPLVPDEETELMGKLSGKLGGSIELEKKIDAEMLGGVVVITHDHIIDGSVRHELNDLRDQLRKLKVH